MILGVLETETANPQNTFFFFHFGRWNPLVHLIFHLVSIAEKLESVIWARHASAETTGDIRLFTPPPYLNFISLNSLSKNCCAFLMILCQVLFSIEIVWCFWWNTRISHQIIVLQKIVLPNLASTILLLNCTNKSGIFENSSKFYQLFVFTFLIIFHVSPL